MSARWLLLVCGCWLMGCHLGYRVETVARPTVDPLVPAAGLATICVLRPQTFGAVAAFQHYDNGRLVGVSQGGQVYLCYRAREGRHHLVARSDNDATLALDVRPGERHFVQLTVNVGPDEIAPVGEEAAVSMLAGLKYVVASPNTADSPPVCNQPIPAACAPGACPRRPGDCPVVLTSL